jgi:nucleotide-binding universal stress UspA family protein
VKADTYLIVVGVDYSDAGALALEHAFELGLQHPPAEVHAVNVAQTYGELVTVELAADPRGFASVSIAEAAQRLRGYVEERVGAFRKTHQARGDQAFPRVVAHLRLEAVAEEIAQIAADLEADIVVVGTHGRSGISRLLLGSVAQAVVKLAPCPVLVVRPKSIPADMPKIEPPCPRCVEARRTSAGTEFWCEQHRERHGQRHHMYQNDRVGAETNMPLVIR